MCIIAYYSTVCDSKVYFSARLSCWSLRGERLHTRNRHLRNRSSSISLSFTIVQKFTPEIDTSEMFTIVRFVHQKSTSWVFSGIFQWTFSGMFQRNFTCQRYYQTDCHFPVDFHWNCPIWNFSSIFQWNFTFVISGV